MRNCLLSPGFRRGLIGLLIAGLMAGAPSAGPAKAAIPAAQKIKGIIARNPHQRAFWGISVVNLETGKPLLAINEDRLFVPASILKIVTGYGAWDTFGPGHRFTTDVLTTGTLTPDGRLNGSLIVSGGGDPSWSYRFFENDFAKPVQAFAQSLIKSTGLTRVDGDLVIDDTRYLHEPSGPDWAWEDLQWSYGARIGAFCFNDGVMALEITPSGGGGAVSTRFMPDYAGASVHNEAAARQGAAQDDLICFKPFDSDRVYLAGFVSPNSSPLTLRLAVSDPALSAGWWLCDELNRQGVTVSGQVRVRHRYHYRALEPMPGPVRRLASIPGRTLAELLVPILEKSINPYAELLLRNIGAASPRGDSPERVAGAEALYARWPGLLKPGQNIQLRDGSGLSRSNLLTPAMMTGLLALIRKSEHFEPFLALLPASGSEGTLRNRLGGRTTGRIFAKTGRITQVVSMAGYVRTAGGRWLAFCVIVNNCEPFAFATKTAIDDIVEILYRHY